MRPEKLKVISTLDPAIDTENMPIGVMVEYFETREIKLIEPYFKPGSRPTIFHIREVPHGMWETFVCAGGENKSERHRRAFMAGVERVENLWQEDGTTLPAWAPNRRVGDHVIMSDKEADERFSAAEREEIGSVVYQHSFLARRIAARFPLPHSCLEQLTRRAFRSADASLSTAPTSNDEHSASTPHNQDATENG